MTEWAWIVIIVVCGLVILSLLGWTYDGTIRKRIRDEVGSRLRERADILREQANMGMGLTGFDPGEEDCQDCPETEDEPEED